MVIEALVALGIITVATVNTPAEIKAPQEVKSISTSIDKNQAVKPKLKPKKKKAVKKVQKADPVKQQPTKELATKETVKSEPVKTEQTNLSSPEQKSNQSNLLYYILGLITLGLVSAYFYFRKGGQTADTKIYTSDELKKDLQQTTNNQTPSDPQSNPDDQMKK